MRSRALRWWLAPLPLVILALVATALARPTPPAVAPSANTTARPAGAEPKGTASPGTASPGAASPGTPAIRMVFTGDVALNWRNTPYNLKTFPWDRNPLRFFAPTFKSADLAVSNMEGVLMERDPKYAEERYNLWAPAASAEVFAQASIGLVSTANNHAFDGRAAGVLETLDRLKKTGVKVMGTGATEAEARQPYLHRQGEACVAIVPATTKSNMPARGPAHLAYYPAPREGELLSLVKSTKAGCAFVVVYIHWGVEMQHFPHRDIRRLAHALVDAGADLVVGHHPHVLQGVEFRDRGVIVFSLGNFVFSNPREETRRTGLLEVELTGGPKPALRALSLVPAQIHRKDYTVRPASQAQAEDLLVRVADYSRPFATQVVLTGGKLRFLRGSEVTPPSGP